MKTCHVLTTVLIATLVAGCVANAESEVPDPGEPAVEQAVTAPSPSATLKPASARRPPIDPSCDVWGCGTNHSRRVLRLAKEHS